MDARQVRTRARLADAVLALAAEHPVSDLTVSQLAAAAQVHRSTFYEHASSPADLLAVALRDELDVIRDRFLVGITPETVADAVNETTRAVLEHVESHSELYRRGLGADSGTASLHAMLSSHFRGSTDLLIEQGSVRVPSGVDRATATSYIADGTVGAITVWLNSPEPRDLDGFLDSFSLLVPAWWPGAGAN